MRGFTPVRSQQQRSLEEKFMAVPDAARAEAHHATLTAAPHVAGSEAGRATALYILERFRSYGLQAELEEFQVLLPEPREVKLEVLEPVKFSGPRPEHVAADPASNDRRTLMGFNAYSASGEATAEVVYAQYGLPADYARLREEGVSAEGKIVIVRYGESFRGVKAKVAEENKAAGLIIYSDPEDDGYHAGDAYPKGPWRPASGVQRGSVLYIFHYPGDPTTPDGPSVPGAPRIDAAQATNMTRVPVLPISYDDARHILENLGGPAAPREWQGGLPFTYHLGPGPAKARLRVRIDHTVKPVWNVVAKIPGAERPEEIIVFGNHHDAWTYGGVDPNSGTTSMLELARGLGQLLGEGWRPRRSIWLCAWDAEEQGLLGSTEWAEKHAAELQQKAVAYLNLDSSVAGDRFGASAVPSLKRFMREVAADVPDPRGGSILERANQQLHERLRRQVVPGRAPGDSGKPIAEREIEIGNLGSGSDYTAFLDHLGIPSTDFGFGGDYGVYHSIFDNHRWMKEFGDPEFRYHVAAARYYGVAALRLSEADLLPFDYQNYGEEILGYLRGIRNKLALLGRASELDLKPVEQAAEELARGGKELHEKHEWAVGQGLLPPNLDRINRALVEAEQAFLLPDGLPRRPWFKHAVFAPGTYTGYASVPLPGVHESVDANDFDEARRQVEALTAAIDRATSRLEAKH
ncbi:MAG: M28 family metallopeptidase [Acidobacteria bacterium]|nr:M28 family metallopeptidase [Acidobacteriota bacterium]